MKIFLFFLVCSVISVYAEENFELQMGKDTQAWTYIRTAEDSRRLEFFRRHLQSIKESRPCQGVPKVFHFIWLGPHPFPKDSKYRLTKWKERHPDWAFKFWTDLERVAPIEGMETCFIRNFAFQILGNEYDFCENFGERAKILAYEILFHEGGVYVDHDVLPLKSFDALNAQHDFYCGLEELAPSVLSTSVIPSTHLMGAKAHHPILKEGMQWLHDNWQVLEKAYPGQSSLASESRVKHRSLWALSEGIERGINQEGNRDRIFPSLAFSGRLQKGGAYAIHSHEASWAPHELPFDRKVEKKVRQMIKREDETMVITLIMAGISFIGCLLLLYYARRLREEGE